MLVYFEEKLPHKYASPHIIFDVTFPSDHFVGKGCRGGRHDGHGRRDDGGGDELEDGELRSENASRSQRQRATSGKQTFD